jgi:hypothetical protein
MAVIFAISLPDYPILDQFSINNATAKMGLKKTNSKLLFGWQQTSEKANIRRTTSLLKTAPCGHMAHIIKIDLASIQLVL